MNTTRRGIFVIAAIFLLTTATSAQQGKHRMHNMNKQNPWIGQCLTQLDLTTEQKDQIKKIKVDAMQEMQQYKNQLNEKRARLRTLQTKDNTGMKEIKKVIKEMGSIRIDLHIKRAETHQKVKEELTKEQKVLFNKCAKHKMKRKHHGKRECKGMKGQHQSRSGGKATQHKRDCPHK